MSQDKVLTEKRLFALWSNSAIPEINTKGNKIVMFSDMHLGDGGEADDFRHNLEVIKKALEYYKKEGYIVILLGDIEEFWQFDLSSIINEYNSTIYKRFRSFESGRFHRIFGNHDSEWGSPQDPGREKAKISAVASEALKLKDKNGVVRVLLIHGHQGSTESDKNSWFSRFFVRLYKKVEPVIKIDRHTSATKSQIAKNYEKIMYTWAKQNKVILICGHSHRAIFASTTYIDKLQKEIEIIQKGLQAGSYNKKEARQKLKELNQKLHLKWNEELKDRKITKLESKGAPFPCYFNTGCTLYTDGGTAIEIEDDIIRLVKWSDKKNIKREIFGQGLLSDFVKEIA